MPFKIRFRTGGTWEVYNPETGEVKGRHQGRRDALRHQRALYANVPEARARRKAEPNYGARAGQVIRGNLARGTGGQFTRAGAAPVERGGLRDRLAAAEDNPKKGKPKKSQEERDAESQQRRQARQQKNRDKVAKGLAGQLAPEATEALLAFADGETLDGETLQMMRENGLAQQDAQGGFRLSPAGRSFVRAANSGDVRGASDALSKAADRIAAEEDRRRDDEEREQKRQQAQSDRFNKRQQQELSRQARRQRLQDERAARLRERERLRQERERLRAERKKTTLAVYKTHSGQWRWVAMSSTAYRDRDGEIVSTKALRDDCDRSDREKSYGPLLWWHEPRIKLGDCDFNAVSGRALVESGTFVNDRVGAAMAKAAKDMQLSIGFFHLPTEPDREGVFHTIRRFERSLAPRGYVSNPFTGFIVNQKRSTKIMDPAKQKALLAALDNDQALLDSVMQQVDATQKAAEQAGVAYKAQPPAKAGDTLTFNDVSYKVLSITEDGKFTLEPAEIDYVDPAKEKAEEPAKAKAPAEAPAAEVTVSAAGEPAEEEGDGPVYMSDLTVDEYRALMAELMGGMAEMKDALAQLQAGDKLRSSLDEIKTLLGGMTAQAAKKDAEAADAKARIAGLERQVSELTGDMPSGVKSILFGYQASADPQTVVQQPRIEKASAPDPAAGIDLFITEGLSVGVPAHAKTIPDGSV